MLYISSILCCNQSNFVCFLLTTILNIRSCLCLSVVIFLGKSLSYWESVDFVILCNVSFILFCYLLQGVWVQMWVFGYI